MSRSWQNRSYVKSVGLVIIDEIHLLGADRGPVLEVIVRVCAFVYVGVFMCMIASSSAFALVCARLCMCVRMCVCMCSFFMYANDHACVQASADVLFVLESNAFTGWNALVCGGPSAGVATQLYCIAHNAQDSRGGFVNGAGKRARSGQLARDRPE